MAKFVNYRKRSVTLPKGCKDLMDLLGPARSTADTWPGSKADVDDLDFLSKARVTTVGQIDTVTNALELPTETPWVVGVYPAAGDEFSICFCNPGEPPVPRLLLVFLDRPEWQAGILGVLKRRELTVANPDKPASALFPGMPSFCAWRITGPLPEVTGMGTLARQLLTEGLGLTADASVRVNHELLLLK
jgi:hypothetical protein